MLLGDCRTSSSIKKSRAYMAATWHRASIDYLIRLEEMRQSVRIVEHAIKEMGRV